MRAGKPAKSRRLGCPWRDLLNAFKCWNLVYKRFNAWSSACKRLKAFQALIEEPTSSGPLSITYESPPAQYRYLLMSLRPEILIVVLLEALNQCIDE